MNNDANYYVVLNDGETYSSEGGSYVCILNDEGESELNTSDGMDDVSPDNVVKKVPVSELIECWIRNNRGF